MVAMELYRKYGIPYIVAVRNCDINAFMRYMPHLWWVHRAVLEATEKVIFIAPALQQRLLKHPTLAGIRDSVSKRVEVIPNGINEYWINHLQTTNTANPHHVLYVGNFTSNKNLTRLIYSILALYSEFPEIHLDVAGAGGDNERYVLSLIEKHPECITYHGKITDLERLQELYRANSIMAMPSKSETFGLVYIEALSQGLKVLWSRGEAIDGMFHEHIGEHVIPLNNYDITNALDKMMRHPENYETLSADTFEKFRWSSVAQRYLSIYSQLHNPENS